MVPAILYQGLLHTEVSHRTHARQVQRACVISASVVVSSLSVTEHCC